MPQRLALWYCLWDAASSNQAAGATPPADAAAAALFAAAAAGGSSGGGDGPLAASPPERCLLTRLLEGGGGGGDFAALTPHAFALSAAGAAAAAASASAVGAAAAALLQRLLSSSDSESPAPAAAAAASSSGRPPPLWVRPRPAVLTPAPSELRWLDVPLPGGRALLWDAALAAPPPHLAAARARVARALEAPLLPAQQRAVLEELDAHPRLAAALAPPPTRLPALVENAPAVAYELLLRLARARRADALLEVRTRCAAGCLVWCCMAGRCASADPPPLLDTIRAEYTLSLCPPPRVDPPLSPGARRRARDAALDGGRQPPRGRAARAAARVCAALRVELHRELRGRAGARACVCVCVRAGAGGRARFGPARAESALSLVHPP